jgi:acyl-CoA thioesterase FadM
LHTLTLRVTPFDLELAHAVSHAYLAFAGLGRWHWSFHNINWSSMLRHRWVPFTHSEMIQYQRALRLFRRVTVTSRMIWWDDKMGYFEHRIESDGRLAATAFSCGTFFQDGKPLRPLEGILGLKELPGDAPPAAVEHMRRAGELFRHRKPDP